MDITKFKELFFDKRLVLAISGGVDSVSLLHLFVSSGFNLENLVVAHVDHGIRSDSASDLEFVRGLASKYGVRFEGVSFDVPSMDGNLEANCRRVRYDFLNSLGGDYVVTAHHQDDQAETVFMNFLKGSFVRGMAGMKVIDEDLRIFRPLLEFSKKELISYANAAGLEYVVDSTNSDSSYDRNFLRNDVFGPLAERFGDFSGRIADVSSLYSELDSYLLKTAVAWIARIGVDNVGGVEFSRSEFGSLPSFLQFIVVEELSGLRLGRADFGEIVDLTVEAESGSFRQVGSVYFYISYDKFFVSDLSVQELADEYFKIRFKGVGKRFEEGDKFEDGSSVSEYLKEKKVPWYYRGGYVV